jgi:hypothetical protein
MKLGAMTRKSTGSLTNARLALAVLCISVWWGLGSSNAFAYTATFTEVSRTTTPGAPPWRGWSVATWVGSLGRVVMWGGSGGNFFNDIVALDPGTGAWITLNPDVYCPGNKSFAPPNGSDENGLVWDPIGGRLWIYNGGSGYRCATPQSVGRIAGPGTTPTAIVDSTLSPTTNYTDWQVRAPDGNKAYVTAFNPTTKTLTLSTPLAVAAGGAYDLYVDFGNGTWSYSLATGTYSKLQAVHWGYTGYVPAARKSPGFAGDGTQALMFGGLDFDNGLYSLDFVTGAYTVLIPQGLASPPARGQIQGQFVYDSQHDRFVLFGGRCFDPARCTFMGMLNDTWVYNPTTNQWTQANPVVRPPARNQGQMYFDSAHGVVVLYGGSNGSAVLNDLWTFDVGTLSWTQQALPAINPGGLYLAQVAYAPTTQCAYIVYGVATGGSPNPATWKLCLAGARGNTADFNDDGKSDLVWRNASTGQTAIWLMNGLVATSSVVTPSDPAWNVTQVGDFNGDGSSDIVWRNTTTGATAVWLMNGGTLLPGSGGVMPYAEWMVTHVADFNGDGKDDLVWRNQSTGATVIWLMNGTSIIGSGTIMNDPQWVVTYTGDFNGDGKCDLVWRHTGNGQTAIWMMNGASLSGGAGVMPDANWMVTHVADFNGDGKSDLVWRNTLTGETALWLMNGLSILAGGGLNANPWHVTHLADLNGDGKADLIWRNDISGHTAAWLMNGMAASSSAVVHTDSTWSVTHVADTNGDGKSDLLWRNSVTGTTGIWLMNGTTYSSYATLLTDPQWMLSPTPGF